MKHTRLALLWFALLPAAMSAAARQDEPAPARPPEKGAADDEAARRDEARLTLLRRLERMEKEGVSLREAVEMLDRGEPLEAVRAHVRRGIGEGLRDRVENRRDTRDRGAPPPPGNRAGRVRPDAGGMGGVGGGGNPDDSLPSEPRDRSSIEPERAMEVLRQANPPLFERLDRLRESEPEQFRALIERFAPRLAEFDRERAERPEQWRVRSEMFRLDREAARLARRATSVPEEERGAAALALRDAVARQFDLRLRLREQEVGRLNERVDEIRRQIGEAARHRDAEVARRVRQLMRDAREGRDTPDAPPPPAPPAPHPPTRPPQPPAPER